MKRSLFFLFTSLLSVHVWGAPVEVIESADLQKRVARLERMLENPVLLQLSDRLAEQEKEIQQLGDQIDRLNWRIKQLKKRHQQDIAALQAQIEDLSHKLHQQATLQTVSPDTLEADEQKTASVPAATPTPAVPAATPAPAPAVRSKREAKTPASAANKPLKPADKGVVRAYDEAMTLLRKARYQQAAEAFKAFLEKYGDTQLAPNAAYWAGEAYMAELKYQKAWPYFERVIKQYPDSNKYDDSLYRGADALYQSGKKQEAIALLKRLLQTKKAENKLKQRAEKTLKTWAQATQ